MLMTIVKRLPTCYRLGTPTWGSGAWPYQARGPWVLVLSARPTCAEIRYVNLMTSETTRNLPEHFPDLRLVRTRARSRPERHGPDQSSPGTHLSVVDSRFDRKHGTGGVQQDALGVGAQDQLADRSASAQPDHDEVRVDLVGHLDQIL